MSLINCVLVYVYLGTYIYFGVRHSRAHYTYTHIPCTQTPERPVRRLVCIEEGRLLERKSRRRLSSHPSMTLSRLGYTSTAVVTIYSTNLPCVHTVVCTHGAVLQYSTT